MALPELPSENENPWYQKRSLWDEAVGKLVDEDIPAELQEMQEQLNETSHIEMNSFGLPVLSTQDVDVVLATQPQFELLTHVLSRKPEFVLTFGFMPCPVDKVPQGFAYDTRRGDYYTCRPTDDALYIYRMSASGQMVSYCIIQGGPHGNNLTLETVGSDVYLYFYQTTATGTNGKSGPVKFKYSGTTAGQVFTSDSANFTALTDFNNGMSVDYSIDVYNNRIAVFKYDSAQKQETIQLRNFDEFKAGVDNVLATITYATPQVGDTGNLDWQGIQTVDNLMFVWRGGAFNIGVPTLYVYDWDDPTADPKILDLNWMNLDHSFARQSLNEAEGLSLTRDSNGVPTLMFGVSSGVAGSRRNSVFSVTPSHSINPLKLKSDQYVFNRNQSGHDSVVTTAANTTASKTVVFSRSFETIPEVVVQPQGSTPEKVTGWSINGVTVSGFTVYMRTTAAQTTLFSWLATEN